MILQDCSRAYNINLGDCLSFPLPVALYNALFFAEADFG